jgi:hypothetical protein
MSDEERTAADVPLPGGEFRLLVTRFSFQAMLALGLLENPLTKTKQKNPDGARMVIDDLLMLREKTLGNLDPDEAGHLDKVIRDLESAFVKLEQRA